MEKGERIMTWGLIVSLCLVIICLLLYIVNSKLDTVNNSIQQVKSSQDTMNDLFTKFTNAIEIYGDKVTK